MNISKAVLNFPNRPVIDQNLFYAGMKSTTATFAAAMTNVVPAFVFIMAWIIRYKKQVE